MILKMKSTKVQNPRPILLHCVSVVYTQCTCTCGKLATPCVVAEMLGVVSSSSNTG